jgi:DNA invertase Pin-like site-specific DNA recombinase/glutaredoxin 2
MEYERKIKENIEWDFVGLYADEGISGTSIKKRPEFIRMIDDAKEGKINLILTKSLSRFARNTVDTLTIVRELREIEVEVFFEKENISSLDTKVDFMLTIFSSIAQEESRNISENVKWGFRKRFQEGKVHINTNRFLGYDKDKDGKIIINKEQSKTVTMIFDMYISGMSNREIVEFLMKNEIKNGRNEVFWRTSSISSILTNEKYVGDAILQKRVTVDYLTHKSVKNTGQAPQYLIENNHVPIISRKKFELVQQLKKKRSGKSTTSAYGNKYPLSGLVYCSHCGKKMNRHYYNYGKDNQRIVLSCKNRYKDTKPCGNKPMDNATLEQAVIHSIKELHLDRPDLVKDVLEIVKTSLDTSELDKEIVNLKREYSKIENELREIMNMNLSEVKNNSSFYRDMYNKKKETLREVETQISNINEEKTTLHLHDERIEQIKQFLEGYTALNRNILNGLYKAIISTSRNDVIFVICESTLTTAQTKKYIKHIQTLEPIIKGKVHNPRNKLSITYSVVKLEGVQ